MCQICHRLWNKAMNQYLPISWDGMVGETDNKQVNYLISDTR